MFCTVPPCPLCLPQPLLWPRRPGSGHGSHAGGGGSGQVAAGEVVVGALVPILVPVVGLVQVAAVLLLLLEVGAALLLVVGAALLLLLVAVGAADHHYTPLVHGFIQGVAIWEKDIVAVIFSAQPNSYTVAGGLPLYIR